MIPSKEYGIMLDLETLGVDDDALITQIGAVVFDLKTGDIFNKFNEHLDFSKLDRRFEEFYEKLVEIRKMDTVEKITNLDIIIQDLVDNQFKDLCEKFDIEKGTMNFWIRENSNLDILLEHLTVKTGLSEKQLMSNFKKFIDDSQEFTGVDFKIWGNGISFDVVKIKRKLKKHGLQLPITFYNERDLRTILELASFKSGKDIYEIKESVISNARAHDAFEDCIFQINVCHESYKILMS